MSTRSLEIILRLSLHTALICLLLMHLYRLLCHRSVSILWRVSPILLRHCIFFPFISKLFQGSKCCCPRLESTCSLNWWSCLSQFLSTFIILRTHICLFLTARWSDHSLLMVGPCRPFHNFLVYDRPSILLLSLSFGIWSKCIHGFLLLTERCINHSFLLIILLHLELVKHIFLLLIGILAKILIHLIWWYLGFVLSSNPDLTSKWIVLFFQVNDFLIFIFIINELTQW